MFAMSSLTADRWSEETSAAVSEWLRWALWSSLAVHIASVVVTSSPLARNAISPEFFAKLARELNPISQVTMIYLAAVETFWIAGKACVLAARPLMSRTTECLLTLLSLAGDGLMVFGLAMILVRPQYFPLLIAGLLLGTLGTLGPLFGLRWGETRGGWVTRGGMIAAEMCWMVLLITTTGITLWVWGSRFLSHNSMSSGYDIALYSAPVLCTLLLLLVGGVSAWSRRQPLTGKALGVALLVAAAEGMIYYILFYLTMMIFLFSGWGGSDTAANVATMVFLVFFTGFTVLGARIVAVEVSRLNDR